jgi:hypothetical protein
LSISRGAEIQRRAEQTAMTLPLAGSLVDQDVAMVLVEGFAALGSVVGVMSALSAFLALALGEPPEATGEAVNYGSRTGSFLAGCHHGLSPLVSPLCVPAFQPVSWQQAIADLAVGAVWRCAQQANETGTTR